MHYNEYPDNWLHDLDDVARARLGFIRGVPATSTMWRLLTRLDADLLARVLAGWLLTRTRPAEPPRSRYRQVIAIDGKTMRAARRGDGGQVHLLSALDTSTGIILAQVTVAAKSNEIPAFAPLLDAVEQILGSLRGLLFVADALHTQTGHANEIAGRGAHLLIPVKGNRPTLFAQLKTLPWAQIPVGDQSRDRGHGRRETRTVKAVTVSIPGGILFPHAHQAVRITRTRTIAATGKTSRETAYLTTSLPHHLARTTPRPALPASTTAIRRYLDGRASGSTVGPVPVPDQQAPRRHEGRSRLGSGASDHWQNSVRGPREEQVGAPSGAVYRPPRRGPGRGFKGHLSS